jgi:hypothetical protein
MMAPDKDKARKRIEQNGRWAIFVFSEQTDLSKMERLKNDKGISDSGRACCA